MGLGRVTAGQAVPDEINVIIEIPARSGPVKYEVDKKTESLFVDRFLSTCMYYPCDYGYLPKSLSKDGDPLDVLVITPVPVDRGCVLRCRPIGMLSMEDEAGDDRKILAVPIAALTALYTQVHKPDDLPALLLQQISHFFTHYKDLEENKWVKLNGWLGKEVAKKEILASIQAYNDALEKGTL